MNSRIVFVSLVCALFMEFAWAPAAPGQSLLDRLTDPFRGEQPSSGIPAPAADPAPATASSYIGLVGDDRDTGGRGVRVLTIRPGSPAEKAGLQIGDLITGIGSQAIRSIADMADVVSRTRPGERLDMTVERGGSRASLTVIPTLRPPPDDAGPGAPAPETLPPPRSLSPPAERAAEPPGTVPADAPVTDSGRPYLGIRVAPLDPTSRREIPLLVRRGVVIRTVDPGSPAARAGLPVGGVIVAVDGQRVASSEDLVAIVSGMRPGQEIEVLYYRGRTPTRQQMVLAARPDDTAFPPVDSRPDLPLLVPPGRDGEGDIADRGLRAPAPLGGGVPRDGDLPPAVREVERVIGDILEPRDRAAAPPAAGDVAAMRAELAELRDQVRVLQARVAELERLLPGPELPPRPAEE